MDSHDKAIIHSSKESDYRTPPECVVKLHAEFGFCLDLAATADNRCCSSYLGPGSSYGEDALTVDWAALMRSFWPNAAFLNPPFSKTLMNAYNTGRIKIDGAWQEHEKNPTKAGWYDVANWAQKCWEESQKGATIVGIFPFAPQTEWYRHYVYGIQWDGDFLTSMTGSWSGHAAREERRLPHRISFLTPDGRETGNAGVNSVILVWKPNHGLIGPWQPHTLYWSYR